MARERKDDKMSDFLHQGYGCQIADKLEQALSCLYPEQNLELAKKRVWEVYAGFQKEFDRTSEIRLFSVPGRTELGGNHTDHQQGRVLASAVSFDSLAAAAPNGTNRIRIYSQGYGKSEVSLSEITPRECERHTPSALIRGVATYFLNRGYSVKGFDAYISSQVAAGSGLSSSAAFEVLIGCIMQGLYGGEISPVLLAQAGRDAENRFFGKSCGLMDQMACAQGSAVYMDFGTPENPKIEKISFDPSKEGYALCLIDCGANHEGLSEEYGEIVSEMRTVANYFGKAFLREVDEGDFFASFQEIRKIAGDRAVLRSLHFFEENTRVRKQVQALKGGKFSDFLQLVRQSGNSSYRYLENIYPCGASFHQEMAIVLALCDFLLKGEGAYRVHGGGFGGTVQAYVPLDRLSFFVSQMEEKLKPGCCQILSTRMVGATQIL